MSEQYAALLAALPDHDDWAAVQAAFPGMKRAVSVRDCVEQLARGGVTVVVSNRDFIDGTWRDLLRLVRETITRPPRVLVMDRGADESMWLEVLDAGGFDLLPKPAGLVQLRKAVEAAQASWREPGKAMAATAGC